MYVVVENTPGYLPEDDDPAVVSTLREARMVARDLVARLRDYHAEDGEACTVRTDSRTAPRSWYVVTRRAHDLGRVVEIMDYSCEDEACRGCGTMFPYDPDADFCPRCAAENAGDAEEVAAYRWDCDTRAVSA